MLYNLNKIIPVVLLFAGFSCGAQVANCDGGTRITGQENGHEYCISKITMNWWSAHSWCRAQGRHLASVTEACNGNAGGCANLRGTYNTYAPYPAIDRVWTSTPARGKYADCIGTPYGSHTICERADRSFPALCY